MNQSRNILIAVFFLFSSLHLHAQILSSELLNNEVFRYQKAEWKVVLKASWDNPYVYSDIALDMKLTSPSGKQIVLPCFYESGESLKESGWKARFAARESGVYSYQFELKKKGKVVYSSPKANFKVKESESKGFLSVNDLWTLRYDNGELFRGIGENICWESRDEDDSKYFEGLHEDKRFNYNYMLEKLAANDGNFFRTWMIYWNLPVDWKTVRNNSRYRNTESPYNESGMKRMDELVELCDSLGIHMMLALESHVGYMGGGWEISNYNIANGGTAKTPYDFFTLPEAKQQYKNKLRLMVARYGYSPAIGAWEFFNEIDNAMFNGKPEDQIPASAITAWHDEMSTFLKSVDPYQHIVTTSVSHRDVEGMNDLKNIDINQRHIYKNTSGIPKTILDYTQKHNKPYVIGESGYEWDWSKNFNDFAGEMDADFKRALWLGLFNPTPILPMSWWWEFFENRGMMSFFKQVSEINRSMLEAGKGKFELLNLESLQPGIDVYSVRCGETVYIYVHNSASSPADIHISGVDAENIQGELSLFDCDAGTYIFPRYKRMTDNSIQIEQVKLKGGGNLVLIWAAQPTATIQPKVSDPAEWPIITRKGDQLMEGDKVFRFLGLAAPNIQQNESQIRVDRTNRFPDEYEIRDILDGIRRMGGRATRTFSLSVYSPDDKDMPVYISGWRQYNEEAFQCLDRVIALSHEYDVRLIIPFIASQTFAGIRGVDEFSAIAGKPKGAFWTDPEQKADFRHFLDFVLNRKNTVNGILYKNDPAILAWQLGNEFGSYPGDRGLKYDDWSPKILAWSLEMAAYIKKVDPNHLVMEAGGADREKLIADPNIDVISDHLYEYWNKMGGRPWELSPIALESYNQCKGKKPLMIDEFGLGTTENLRELMKTIRETNIVGGLLWSIRSHRSDGGWYYHNEGGTTVNSFHVPGFSVGYVYDEIRLLDLLREESYLIRGIPVPEVEKPAPAPVLFLKKDGFTWRGSTGAAFYTLERSETANGPWKVIATGLEDSVLADVAKYEHSQEASEPLTLYTDESAQAGKIWFYRIKGVNISGESEYSEVVKAIW